MPYVWRTRSSVLEWHERPLILGIINVTPDSFSDGGEHFSPEGAVVHGLALVQDGADLLDIGGESTRPGATPVAVEEELRRVVPVVETLVRQCKAPLSVDTYKAEVARQCLDVGAEIINDVTGLEGDAEMVDVVRRSGAGAIVMHMQGNPQTMQVAPHYVDVVCDIKQYLSDRLRTLRDAGIDPDRIVVDPGVGFGKTGAQCWKMLRRLGEFQELGRPVCLGVSRKGFIGKLIGRDVRASLAGSLAIACAASVTKAAQILRVHDVKETRDAVTVIERILRTEAT